MNTHVDAKYFIVTYAFETYKLQTQNYVLDGLRMQNIQVHVAYSVITCMYINKTD